MQPLQEQCKIWKQTLESYCKKTFPKIRIKSIGLKPSVADKVILERNKLKTKQDKNESTPDDDTKLIEYENVIADILSKEGRDKAYKFKKYCAQYESVSVKEMWKLKKRLWPKNKPSIQTGKFNHQGKLVTSPDDIKTLLGKEYSERLRARPEHPDMKNIFKIKKEVFQAKIKEINLNKSADRNMRELEEVLRDV